MHLMYLTSQRSFSEEFVRNDQFVSTRHMNNGTTSRSSSQPEFRKKLDLPFVLSHNWLHQLGHILQHLLRFGISRFPKRTNLPYLVQISRVYGCRRHAAQSVRKVLSCHTGNREPLLCQRDILPKLLEGEDDLTRE